MAPDPDCYLKLPLDPDMPPTQDLDQPPQIGQSAGGTNDISIVGSGGGFLSNEVYYRASALRFAMRKTLASGHIHLPVFQDVDVPAKRTLLFNGVGELLKRLIAELRRPSTLPPLRITRLSLKAKPNVLSQAVTVQADNSKGTARLDIRKVQIYQAGTQFRLSVPNPQPFSVDPGKTRITTKVPARATTGPLEIETPFGRVSRTFTVT